MKDRPKVTKQGSRWIAQRPLFGFRTEPERTRHTTWREAHESLRPSFGSTAGEYERGWHDGENAVTVRR